VSDTDAGLVLRRDGPVGWLLLQRPERKNALNLAMLDALPRLLQQAAAEPQLRVLIVSGGAGQAFCAGADILEFAEMAGDDARLRRFAATFAAAQTAMADFIKPAIAMISGPCIGGGCGLALGCDLRLADSTARFAITPAKLGLEYGRDDCRRLVEAVGAAAAAELLFSARTIDADAALALRLISRHCAPPDLEAVTVALAQSIAANAPSSLRALKAQLRAVRGGALTDDAASRDAFVAAFHGRDFAEGMAAFQEKRPPRFTAAPDAAG
jgi:enoyl-CoA hydratase/carnithine racemase